MPAILHKVIRNIGTREFNKVAASEQFSLV